MRESLFRIGHDSDWAQIANGPGGAVPILALKKDGRLVESDRELFSTTLGQPSRYSDWIAVGANPDGLITLAVDGTVSLWKDQGGWEQPGELLGPTHAPLWSLNVLTNSE